MKTILHVEDSHDWLSTVRGSLEDAGFNVISVNSVAKARSQLKKADIVICDGNLEFETAGDGFDLALKLHNQGRKVLVLAARPRDLQVPFYAKGRYESAGLVEMLAKL